MPRRRLSTYTTLTFLAAQGALACHELGPERNAEDALSCIDPNRCVLLPAPGPSLLIDELMFQPAPSGAPLQTTPWVELFNPKSQDVHLLGYKLENRGGAQLSLPPRTIPANGRLVIAMGSGQDDATTAWAGPYNLGPQTGSLSLLDPMGGLVDFVSWHNPQVPLFLYTASYQRAVAMGHWPNDQNVLTRFKVRRHGKRHELKPGESIGRDADSRDTNAPRDWFVHGGRDASRASPGAPNRNNQVIQGGPPQTQPQPQVALPQKKWLVLLYAAGDNDLEKNLLADLNEVEQTLNNAAIDAHVVVQFEGVGPMLGQRGYLQGDANDDVLTFHELPGDTRQLGELDMADPANLRSFISTALNAFQGKYERRALILSSHGDGWRGVLEDGGFADARAATSSTAPINAMTIQELRGAIDQSFDLIAFDACSMAEIEVAYQLHDRGRGADAAIVFSQLTVPGDGLNYRDTLMTIGAQNSGAQLAQRMVQTYEAKYGADYSLSAFKLGAPLQALYDKLNAFAVDMGSDKPTRTPFVQAGLDDHLGNNRGEDNVQLLVKAARGESTLIEDKADLQSLMEKINTQADIPGAYKAHIADVRAAIQAARLDNRFNYKSPLNGISIYFPATQDGGGAPECTQGPCDDLSFLRFNSPGAYATFNSPEEVKYGPDDRPSYLRDAKDKPIKNVPGFLFSQNEWVHFLHRYLEPVARASCRSFLGTRFAVCHAFGSSSADTKLERFIWDTSPNVDTASILDDSDLDGLDETNDDLDLEGERVSVSLEGRFPGINDVVVLTVWSEQKGKNAGIARETDQDAAQIAYVSLGAKFEGEPMGTLGDLQISLHNTSDEPIRNLTLRARWPNQRLNMEGASAQSDRSIHRLVFANVTQDALQSIAQLQLVGEVAPGEQLQLTLHLSEGSAHALTGPEVSLEVSAEDLPAWSSTVQTFPAPALIVPQRPLPGLREP